MHEQKQEQYKTICYDVKLTDQLLFKNKFPNSGLTFKTWVVNSQHQIPQRPCKTCFSEKKLKFPTQLSSFQNFSHNIIILKLRRIRIYVNNNWPCKNVEKLFIEWKICLRQVIMNLSIRFTNSSGQNRQLSPRKLFHGIWYRSVVSESEESNLSFNSRRQGKNSSKRISY